eukprot:Nitzschia sp. Nitz4//scaffold562_size5492//366//866//NITZ4_009223-RA/size5492-exonerate_est2genome-gene-0.0-mRNA-1//-1//CDS//3329554623//3452//frame0
MEDSVVTGNNSTRFRSSAGPPNYSFPVVVTFVAIMQTGHEIHVDEQTVWIDRARAIRTVDSVTHDCRFNVINEDEEVFHVVPTRFVGSTSPSFGWVTTTCNGLNHRRSTRLGQTLVVDELLDPTVGAQTKRLLHEWESMQGRNEGFPFFIPRDEGFNRNAGCHDAG